jgi:hypothetical protein
MDMDAKGKMTVLRKGTNGWTCPHWMILYPVPNSSGLPTTPKNTGTWIMYAGTPWAHLMINGKP